MTKDKKYTNKEYVELILKEYPRRKNVIKKLDLDIKELRLSLGYLGGVDYSKDRIQTSNVYSSVENEAIRVEKQIEDIEKEKEKKDIHFDRIEIALDTLTDLQNKIVEYRHFKGYTWSMVEKYIGYTDRQCININNEIIKLLINHYNIKPS